MSQEGSIWYVHPYAGGPGVGRYDRPFHLAHHWQALGRRSVVLTAAQHHLLDKPRAPGVEQIDDVTYEFIDTPTYSGNGLGRLCNMAAFTLQLARQGKSLEQRHGRPAMVIASSPHPYVWFAVRNLARRFGARSVFEVRDLWPLSLVELAGVSPGHPLVLMTGWLERNAYRTADSVVSLLPKTLEHMQALGLDPARWHYIPNGVEDTAEPGTASDQPCTQLAREWSAQGRTVIVYAGALGRPNHVESLLKAIALLRDVGTDAGAIIVGRGEQEETLKAMVTELGLQDRVRIFGQIPKVEIPPLLKAASAGYISLRPEPLFRFGISPNKLFDYMLAALPVLFAVQAGNDPVADAACGFSVDPGDPQAISAAIVQLAGLTEEACQEMGERGRTYVLQRHGYRRLAENYLRLLAPGAT